MKPYIVVNFKNHNEVLGGKAFELAKRIDTIAYKYSSKVSVIIAPPDYSVSEISKKVSVPVFVQTLDDRDRWEMTGARTAKTARAFGVAGALLNHNEAPRSSGDLTDCVTQAKEAGLKTIIFSKDIASLKHHMRLNSDFVAIEPPELIGTGRSVTDVHPELITSAVAAAKEARFRGIVLCGAGLSTGKDFKTALELGAAGGVLSTAVVKASNPEAKMEEILSAVSE